MPRISRRRSALTLAVFAGVTACDETPETFNLGSMDITTSAPAASMPLTTADGWTVKLDRFLVHVTAVNVSGDDKVLAASAPPQIVDQVAPATKSLLSAPLRTARAWEDVSFSIGPARPDTATTVIEPTTDADRVMMETDGIGIYLVGTATKGDVSRSFHWGLKADTLYSACQGDRNGSVLRGLVVPKDGNDTADIAMDPTVFFSEDLGGVGPLSAEALLTDVDNDGTVTMADLHATPPDAARLASIAASGGTVASELGAFVEALAPKIVKTFRAAGTCTAEPTIVAP